MTEQAGTSAASADYLRGLRDALTIVDRAVRPLGVPPGGTDSPWNLGYRQAKNEAKRALMDRLDALRRDPTDV